MQDSFAQLMNKFYQVKDSNNSQQYAQLIEQLQAFIDKYRDVLEVDEQVILAQALEYQLVLYVLSEQTEQAEAVEQLLNDEFYGIHKIGKPIDVNPNAPASSGKLNLSSKLLDMNRLKRFAIKQKGTTKPKILGWVLKITGIALIALTAWLFTLNWLWTPLILGIIGVFLSTIGTQVNKVVNSFFSTIAFNLGNLIPGVIIKVDKDSYQAMFIAPLMKTKEQAPRWGVKTVNFKKAAGTFIVGEQLAGVCAYPQNPSEYYQDFMPTPVCLGYNNEVIPYKAKQVIAEPEWQRLLEATNQFKNDSDELIIVDNNFHKIS